MDQQSESDGMMDDRELLEMAAKAAGYKGQWDKEWWAMCDGENHWNPLRHNGQALRLAAKLHLWEAIRLAHRGVSADTDIYAATRRAIVRAAAELARATAQKD